jgi:hypothetical protein
LGAHDRARRGSNQVIHGAYVDAAFRDTRKNTCLPGDRGNPATAEDEDSLCGHAVSPSARRKVTTTEEAGMGISMFMSLFVDVIA